MTTMTKDTNGINVEQLVGTIDAIKNDDNLGHFTFKAASEWVDGTHSKGWIQGFTHAGAEDETRAAAF